LVSVLILAKNEEHDLPGCLESVSWCDDIHVLDSSSADKTAAVAAAAGAHVRERVFDNYAAQRNSGLHETTFKHAWVLLLDADERIPEELANEMRRRIPSTNHETSAFRVRRRDFWMGTWLRHAQISPFYIRLVRPGKVHYEREVNEVLIVDGAIEELEEPFDHYPFSKGVGHWLEKHNRYSTMEADQVLLLHSNSKPGETISFRKALFHNDFNIRRYHQKALFYRMPFRPFMKFCYMLFARRAFLDGRAGIAYSFLQSIYEYMIVLKTRERKSSLEDSREGR